MLELKNISFQVASDGEEKGIIRDISLTISDGKLVVITGPNGGGKSTLAKLIVGIFEPTEGQILLFPPKDIEPLVKSKAFFTIIGALYKALADVRHA